MWTDYLKLTTYPGDAAVAPGDRASLAIEIQPGDGMHLSPEGEEGQHPLREQSTTLAARPAWQPPHGGGEHSPNELVGGRTFSCRRRRLRARPHPGRDGSIVLAASIGLIVTCLLLLGLLERRDRTVARMGLDSLAVLVTYGVGLAGLYHLR